MKNSIGERIRYLRKQLNLNQYEFALRLEIKQPSLSQIEKGIINPSLKIVQSIAEEFNISYDWLLDNHGSMKRDHSGSPVSAGVKSLHPIRLVTRTSFETYARNCKEPDYLEALPLMFLPTLEGAEFRAFEVENNSLAPSLMEGDLVVCSAVSHPSQIVSGHCYILVGKDNVQLHRVQANLYWQQVILVAVTAESHLSNKLRIDPDNLNEVWQVFGRITLQIDSQLPGAQEPPALPLDDTEASFSLEPLRLDHRPHFQTGFIKTLPS